MVDREQIERAGELVVQTRHVALATVNQDGTPHNSPLFFIYSSDFSKVYWGSHPDSLHSQNIQRTQNGYMVVYDSHGWGLGGMYITLKNAHRTEGDELAEAVGALNARRKHFDLEPFDPKQYGTEGGQAMYTADVAKVEIYGYEKDKQGNILKEGRIAIEQKDLAASE